MENALNMISCPSCNQLVDPHDRYCPHCEVDLGISAILAEQVLRRGSQFLQMPITPEVLIPRIGDYLLQKDLVNQKQINKAVKYQKEQEAGGKSVLIGQALVELGFLDQSSLDIVVTEQIFQLQSALQRANQELEERVTQRTAELQQAMVRLTELNQLKSSFISNISHELRTPLTHLKGYLELMNDDGLGHLNPQQKEAVRVMVSSEIRLERLIEDLLQFSMAARGDIGLRLSSLDLRNVMREILKSGLQKSKRKNIRLVSCIPNNLPEVVGDAEKLEWVISELMNNALKFTPEGGIVEVGAVKNNPLIYVYVKDNGIGIPPDKLEQIFEPFHQIDSSTTRKYGGTGLGLSLVQRIVEAHDSKVLVQSSLNKGSRFTFGLSMTESTIVGR